MDVNVPSACDIYGILDMFITNGQRDSGLKTCKTRVNMSSGMIRNTKLKPNSKLTRALSRVFIVLVLLAFLNEI